MRGKNINFGGEKNKKLNRIDDTDVNNILVSKKQLYGNKNS